MYIRKLSLLFLLWFSFVSPSCISLQEQWHRKSCLLVSVKTVILWTGERSSMKVLEVDVDILGDSWDEHGSAAGASSHFTICTTFGNNKTCAGTCCSTDKKDTFSVKKVFFTSTFCQLHSFYHAFSVSVHFVLDQTLTSCCREMAAIKNHK